ncbi:MAG: 16S rRNA (adenine(1518)-N(6)/adenine(1519)-N(6))-dimethyltransferase RsmA [Endozoicomonadaceae bacterium]|nr:16S rRNA (adenine(1518)-N(6)/adenine(1519)-N(6))-dimethyltransferase RsmA [Endozoicomonadaceae bacterium]MBE8232973.1 16S rRNA (adenine(1518)-N(6)/adenine(1519)-N(6))-dimethyltransferase RsmA [Endozoicomonadaceae bacterium]
MLSYHHKKCHPNEGKLLNEPIPKKRFGQNFLHDSTVISKIIQVLSLKKSDYLVEIGPGQGALTQHLLAGCQQLNVIEIDYHLADLLKSKWGHIPNFNIIVKDVLQYDFELLMNHQQAFRVIGNLPYNISTPVLFHLIQSKALIQDMHFMLQREVVDRLTAKPGTKQYGRLTVMMQYFCQIDQLFYVSSEAFKPKPKVESAVVRLIPYTNPPVICHHLSVFETIVRHGFTLRRKTLKNSLAPFISVQKLEQLEIDPMRRSDTLTVLEWVNIANILKNIT